MTSPSEPEFASRCGGCCRPLRHFTGTRYFSEHYQLWFCAHKCMWEWQGRISFRLKQDKIDRVYGDDEISF